MARRWAGVLYAVAWSLPFVINAVSSLVSYLAITAIDIPLQEPRSPQQSQAPMRRCVLDGLRWLFAEPFLRASVLYGVAFTFVLPALVLAVIVRATSHGASSAEIGVIFAMSGAGGVAGALLTPGIQRCWPPVSCCSLSAPCGPPSFHC